MTAPVRAASLLLFLAIIALGGGLLALHFAGASPAQAQGGSAPAQPSGLSTEAFYNYVDLTWDDPEDNSITHYQVLRRDRDIHDTGEFVTIDSDTRSAATSYTDDTVEPEKRYVYRVKAVNQHGASKWSKFARANTPAAPTPDPTPAPTPTYAGTNSRSDSGAYAGANSRSDSGAYAGTDAGSHPGTNSGAEHTSHGRAHHQRHGPGGRDADGGHHGHRRCQWAGRRCLQLPVDPERRKWRRGHIRREGLHIYPGRSRQGQEHQGAGDLHRRRR